MRNANKEITKKHDHTLTNLLKGALFSLVMMAPIFSIAVRCGYVMFNKNAYESYTINHNIETTEYITDTNNLVENNTYYINYVNNETSFTTNSGKLYFSESNIITLLQPYTNLDLSLVKCFSVGYYEGSTYNDTIILYDIDGVRVFSLQYNTNAFQEIFVSNNNTIWFVYLNKTTNHHTIVSSWKCYLYIYGKNTNTLDNAFTYGISNLKNETVFNWTQNTAIYTPIHAMTTGLGITEDAIAIMLTYWALMTAIYIIFDIVIVLFTKLTHLLN